MKMWGITNTGLVRSENQDAYAAFTVGGYSAAVVCDGMGGTNGRPRCKRHRGGAV